LVVSMNNISDVQIQRRLSLVHTLSRIVTRAH